MTAQEAERCRIVVTNTIQALRYSGCRLDDYPNSLLIREPNLNAVIDSITQYFETFISEENRVNE